MAIPGMSGASPMDPMEPNAPITSKPEVTNDPLPLVADKKDVKDETQTPPQKKAQASFKEYINNGNALYNETSLIGLTAQLFSKQKMGNEIIVDGFPKGTTLGDVKKMFNLPDGSLRHMVARGGGDFDKYKVEELGRQVIIPAKSLEDAFGISSSELKKMFPDEQYSNWHFGTGL